MMSTATDPTSFSKLDIGCGKWPKEGYTGVDLYVDHPGVLKLSMWNLQPIGDNTITEIYSSHALEHVPKAMVVPTLMEWYRVMMPEGRLELRVPNLEWCVRSWLEHKTNDWWLDTIFGNQNHIGEFHKTGFTAEMMIEYLKAAGFQDIVSQVIWTHDQETLLFTAFKRG